MTDDNSGLEPADVSITGGTGASCSVVTATEVSCTVNLNTSDTLRINVADNAGNTASS